MVGCIPKQRSCQWQENEEGLADHHQSVFLRADFDPRYSCRRTIASVRLAVVSKFQLHYAISLILLILWCERCCFKIGRISLVLIYAENGASNGVDDVL